MSYFSKKKKNSRKPFFYWVIILVLFLVVLILVKSVFNVYLGEKKSRLNRNQSELIFEELKENEKVISEEIEYMKTTKGIENELRDKFRVVKKGEQMAVIINSDDDGNNTFVVKKETIFEKVKNLFGFLKD